MEVLKANSKGERDENQNAVCTRTYNTSKDVQTKKGDFGDISDSVMEQWRDEL